MGDTNGLKAVISTRDSTGYECREGLGRVCDKFVGKMFRQQPCSPRNPPNDCSEDCSGGR